MIQIQTVSPHLHPDAVSSKTKLGLLSIIVPRLPFDDDEEDDRRGDVDEETTTTTSSSQEHEESWPSTDDNDNFALNPYTVILGKGKIPKENLGNKRLRVLASNFLPQYSEANDKRTKTRVVNEIIESIRSAGGGFVKKAKDGRSWSQVTEQAIREKIGYVFRDLLSDKYRSSSKSKAARRQKEQFGRASLKLKRALSQTYPALEGSMSTCSFAFEPLTSKNNACLVLLPPPPTTGGLARLVSCDEEPYPTMPLSLFSDEEQQEPTLEEEADRISMFLDFSQNDYDADELMASPLIFPDE